MPTTQSKNLLYRLMLPFCAPGCGRNPLDSVSGHTIRYQDEYIHLLKKHHILGAATLIADRRDTAVLFSSSEDPEHHAAEDTYFRIASITKTAAAVLTMKLVDQGLLGLDLPVHTWLPGNPSDTGLRGVTLRHLLSHTSGLSDPDTLEYDMQNGRPFPELTKHSLHAQPGEVFRYSNLGFGLIGCIMESILNKPLGAIFEEHLFRPLNMNATLSAGMLPRNKIMPVTRVLPYRKGNDLTVTPLGEKLLTAPDPLCHYGYTAGSMYTDISSLYTLFRILFSSGGSFLSDWAVREMKKPHAEYGRISPSLSYGLGLLIINDPSLSSGSIFGHQGFAYGCVDGAFWEERTGNVLITLNGGCSEARTGRLGRSNRDLIRWSFRKELPTW